jgi:hypothetical protein
VLESRELRKALGPDEEAETEGRRQLHNKTIIVIPSPKFYYDGQMK